MKKLLQRILCKGKNNPRRTISEGLTLENLAESGKTFWKFSQSQKGRSIESVYEVYEDGKITIAHDEEKLLSFVEEKNISKCVMYGDVLTKICMDRNDPNFQSICKNEVRFLGGALGEYECKKLLVEKTYSLEHKEGIRVLFSITPPDQVCFLLKGRVNDPNMWELESKFIKWGFGESEKLMKEINERYNPEYPIEKILKIIDDYKEF